MKSNYKYKDEFLKDGFFQVNNLFKKSDLKNVESNLYDFASLFAKKINSNLFKNKKISNFTQFNQFCINLENYNKDYFFNFTTLASNSFEISNIILNERLKKIASIVLNENQNNLLIQQPTLLINIPKNNIILYHWHNAKNSYPKRNKYLNIWFPIIRDKVLNNGTIELAEKSHNQEYPFLEFKGYSENKANALSQYLVPKNYLKNFKIKKIIAKTGSCLAMHPNLLHSSTSNLTKKCSFVIIFKIWSIRDDLTLSSNIQQKYFMNDTCSGADVQKAKN